MVGLMGEVGLGLTVLGWVTYIFSLRLLVQKLQGLMFSIIWSVGFSVGASLGENDIGFGPILEWFESRMQWKRISTRRGYK